MANQPPARPWFRLASITRPAAPTAPAPAPPLEPQPRPPIMARPTFRQSAPSSPVQSREPTPPPPPVVNIVQAAEAALASAAAPPPANANISSISDRSASLPTSPVKKAASPPPATRKLPLTSTSSVPSSPKLRDSVLSSPHLKATAAARVPSPNPSPKIIKPAAQTPPQSPQLKPTAPPPSPLTLPPSQIKSDAELSRIPPEAEQKTVLVQKTIERLSERDSLNFFHPHDSVLSGKPANPEIAHNGKQDLQKDAEWKKKVATKKQSDLGDLGMKVITIAGENRGAIMEVIQSPKKHDGNRHPHYIYKNGQEVGKIKSNGSENEYYSSENEEGKKNSKEKSQKSKEMHSLPIKAFMNSNVQGVNNSIMYNSSCSHHDPGVHLALSKKQPGNGVQVKDQTNGHHS